MTHVSRYKLPKRTEEKLIRNLNLVLSKISKHEEMTSFLGAFLTETEKLMLAKRLAIAVLIEEGLPESRIAESLHVTRITVAKMRYFLESRGQGYKIALQKISREKDLQMFKSLLLEIASYSVRAAGGRI
jgi:uncharacterized protein YerC